MLSSVADVHAESTNAISKARMPVNVACLITDAKLCAGHLRCNQPKRTTAKDHPYSLDDGGLNSEVPGTHSLAAGSIGRRREMGCCRGHVFFRRFRYDAFLFRGRTSGKEARDCQSNHYGQGSMFFHKSERTNCRVGCNSLRLTTGCEKQSCQEKILREIGSSRLVLHGRQLGRA